MDHTPERRAVQIAHALHDIGVMAISMENPFTWTSGILSPFYCDNRLSMSYPKVRRLLTDSFQERALKYEFDYIAGVATAGIAHAAWLADRLSLPLVYARPEPKGYGHRNQIEGYLPEDSKVLLVEDLVATGLSSIQVADLIHRLTGSPPVATLAIFTYRLEGVAEKFQEKGCPLDALCNFDVFVDVALEKGLLNSESHDTLLKWRQNFQSWTLKD